MKVIKEEISLSNCMKVFIVKENDCICGAAFVFRTVKNTVRLGDLK